MYLLNVEIFYLTGGGLTLTHLIPEKRRSFLLGRRNKSYSKTLHQQAYDKLTGMQAFGESKSEAEANGTARTKIFSFSTYNTYWKHTKYFIKYVQENYPKCTTLKSAKKYVNEWLQKRADEGLSAWTVQTEAKALGKLYGITPEDEDYFNPPKRNRADIKRSRGTVKRDRHFSKRNNDELIKFCKGTGLRRNELEQLRGSDIFTKEQLNTEIEQLESIPQGERTQEAEKRLKTLQDTKLFNSEYFIHIRNGKGGRQRFSPIVGKNTGQIVERIQNTPADERVWGFVNKNADIHGYRGDYATLIYKEYARDIKDIPYDKINKGTGRKQQSQVYCCRKDEAGKKLDKLAMYICSKALGHNRIEVVANNYIRGL